MRLLLVGLIFIIVNSELAFSKPLCAVVSPYLPMFTSASESDSLLKGPVEAMRENKLNSKESVYLSPANELDLMKIVTSAYENGCRIIVGLYTSRECLLAAQALLNKDVVIISPTCSHDDINKFKGTIYSGVPSIEDYVKTEAEYINQKSFSKVYVVYNPTDIYSQNNLKFLQKYLKSSLTLVQVGRDGTIMKNTDVESNSVIVYTTYPKDSGPSIDFFSSSSNANKIIIIAGPSWKFDLNIISGRTDKLKRFKEVMIVETLSKSNRIVPGNLKNLNSNVRNIVQASYDVTTLAASCYLKVKSKFSLLKFRNCLKNTNFEGITGAIKFKNGGPFAERKIGLTNFIEVEIAN